MSWMLDASSEGQGYDLQLKDNGRSNQIMKLPQDLIIVDIQVSSIKNNTTLNRRWLP